MKVNAVKIKEFRERHGWSQEHLAKAADVGLRTIQRVESESSGSRETMLCIAAAFDVSFDELTISEKMEQTKSKNNTVNRPQAVNHAVIAIYLTFALSAIASLFNKWHGDINMGEFISQIIFTGFTCIIPYKIHNRSNATRYVLLVLIVSSYFLILGGYDGGMTKLDFVLGIVCVPVEIFIIYKLFNPVSNRWFNRN